MKNIAITLLTLIAVFGVFIYQCISIHKDSKNKKNKKILKAQIRLKEKEEKLAAQIQRDFYRKGGNVVGVYLRITSISEEEIFIDIFFPEIYWGEDSLYNRNTIIKELEVITDELPEYLEEYLETCQSNSWVFVPHKKIKERFIDLVCDHGMDGITVYAPPLRGIMGDFNLLLSCKASN